jgi:hypothetical protein
MCEECRVTMQVMVNLPDYIYQRARRFSELSGLNVEQIIAERLDLLLPPLSSEMDTRPVETLTDEEVISIAEGMMEESLSGRMSALAQKQQEANLSEAERAELKMLLDIYEAGQLRKAEAIVEAVKRGLRLSIEP